jgi:NAD(P)-dependent dehydrogenase (short-subunit alcohol dehydrogenase family)
MPAPTSRPRALVTGAARGIGAEVCRQLAAAGFDLVVTARRLADASAVTDGLADGAHHAVALDLDDPGTVVAAVAALGDEPLDVLVNNAAAYADWAEVPSTADLDTAQRVMATNLFGTWRLVQAVLPALRRIPGARIVTVTSGAGSHGEPAFGLHAGATAVSYAVSKAALNALVAKLAVELAPEGILVNAVDPGLTATAPGMEEMGARPVADGAAGVVWAACLPPGGPTGGFFRDGEPLPW